MTADGSAVPGLGGFEEPRYGAGALTDVAPSVLASLGVPGEPNVLGLPPARRACVLLVDGLGWEQLLAARRHAPFLASLLPGEGGAGGPITASFPTTTATSLTSLGTGTEPGHHGIVGFKVAVPGSGLVLNQLTWDPSVDPEEWQPCATAYERAERAGVAAAYVGPAAFEGSGLNRAWARGGRHVGAESATDVAVHAAQALAAADRSYVVAYHSDLDSYGHLFGAGSEHWRTHLGMVDRLAERLAALLPPGSALYVTADHGMVDIDPALRIDLDAEPALQEGVRVRAGEARMRQVYTAAGAAADVRAAWSERLAGHADVLLRDEAIAAGYFGPVDDRVRPRIGDVVALARGSAALVATRSEPFESSLAGQHGSLTPAELRIPLLRAARD
ncbi:alkaline phosphatase family protein [Nocardiopsis coralliicola]